MGGITRESLYDTGTAPEFKLIGSYPNPFNSSTTIEFILPETEHVCLEIFNILGQKVQTVLDAGMNAGHYNINWDASSQPSGVYFYRLNADGYHETKRVILLK